jgi:AcrR family transcriptional regulator
MIFQHRTSLFFVRIFSYRNLLMPVVETRNSSEGPLSRGPCAISADLVAADQRRRLLEALPRVVAERGLEAATVEQVVKLAQVRRNSFYEQFEDKRDCFAAAYEIAQERLLGVLTFQCYTRADLADRVGSAFAAGLDLLAAEPVLTRLILVEAPAAGDELAARHHKWLDRYGRMLHFAAIGNADATPPKASVEPAVVGGIVSRIKQLVLTGETEKLPRLCPELVQFALSFYDLSGALPPPVAESSQPQSESASVLEPA